MNLLLGNVNVFINPGNYNNNIIIKEILLGNIVQCELNLIFRKGNVYQEC